MLLININIYYASRLPQIIPTLYQNIYGKCLILKFIYINIEIDEGVFATHVIRENQNGQ